MSIEIVPNTKDTDKIVMIMLHQVDITDYIKRRKEFKQNLVKWYTVMWELCNKQLKNYINTNVDYEVKV